MLTSILYFCFIHLSLLIPGYALVKRLGWFSKNSGLRLSLAYSFSVVLYALLSTITYVLKISPWFSRGLSWLVLAVAIFYFIKLQIWRELIDKYRFVLGCFLAMSLFSLLVISLPFNAPRAIVPDPQPQPDRNYSSLNVKVLNVAHTQANDNYVPYRQAQFYVNRSDPAKDSFINEWGVHFFERTPLMGAVTANYFNLLGDKPPIDYTWSAKAADPDHTYKKFQVLAQILNSLLIVPGFFLIGQLFNKRTAYLSALFIIPSAFFLYNEFFTWPKSLVSFFALTSWLLLLERKPRYTFLAGIVSGVAYLTHDLAVFYLGASFIYLLFARRFKEIWLLVLPVILLALPWLMASSVIYDKPSSFIYYPLSTNGIPQTDQTKQIIQQFVHTSPLRLLKIRLDNIVYLFSPYQLLSSEGGQTISMRLWALQLFSVSGALGLGLLIPTILAMFKKLRSWATAIFIFVPVLLCAILIGWPKGLGALHFAEGVVVLTTGLAIYFLDGLKRKFWLILAYAVNVVQSGYFIYYSYHFAVGKWFTNLENLVILITIIAIVVGCGRLIYIFSRQPSKSLTAAM
jgi:hypothetical protein